MEIYNSGTGDITLGRPQYNSWTGEKNWQPTFIDKGDDNFEFLKDIARRNKLSYEELAKACEDEDIFSINIGTSKPQWLTTVNYVREFLDSKNIYKN